MRSLFHSIESFDRTAVVSKVWGYEVWHFNTDTLCMKTLVIYPGCACSYHYHSKKYEIFTCLDSSVKGKLYITLGNRPERLLKRGEHIIISPGTPHTFRVEGQEPGALLEFSTHHLEDDSYRLWSSHIYGGTKVGVPEILSDHRVMFVGDIALDEYISGECNRLSPEAPVPLINIDPFNPDIRQMPGCVGNAAVSCNALGGEAAIVSIIGNDRAGDDLVGILHNLTIKTEYLLVTEKRPTSSKRRVFAGQHYITRIDQEISSEFDDEMEKAAIQQIISCLDSFKPEIVYIGDYDKGMMTKEVISHTVAYAHERGLEVIADPKIRHFHLYNDVDILKPNDVRSGQAMDLPVRTITEVESLASRIREELQCKAVLLTRGSKGMYLLSDDISEHIQALPVPISELSGAGDTAGAALALAKAAGYELLEAAKIANTAASVVVQKTGTAYCTPAELEDALEVAEE